MGRSLHLVERRIALKSHPAHAVLGQTFVFFRHARCYNSLAVVKINSCGTVFCEREWSWHPRPSALPDYDLWFVWAGRGEMRFAGERVELLPGVCLCLRPGGSYDAEHDPKHRLGVCYIHFDFLTPPASPPAHVGRLEPVTFYESLLRRAVQLAHENHTDEASHYVLATLAAMQTPAETSLAPAEREHRERVADVCRYIRENPGRIFTMTELADRAGYSTDHFTRVFTKITGQTPREFCIATRLDRAKELLRTSGMTIEQIARALGYGDVFFFSRQFKQRIGLPPTEFRAR
jgi:AraC-like DNA-binding protein